MKTQSAALLLGSALALGACASTGARNPDDPYEGFNRKMYGFNNALDKAVLEPVAKGYRAVTNEPVRKGVTNFTNNLGEPLTFTNELLQFNVPHAAGTFGRFVINSTIGIAGLFDPATSFGIKRTDEDFGQTLGRWGVKPGPYLVLPFLGSSDPRDFVGWGADFGLNPVNYVQFDGADTLRVSNFVLGGLSARESAIETIDDVRQTQLDPYTTLRRFYVRNRAAQVRNSAPSSKPVEEVPDYEMNF
ncbi:MAG: VacJ family lipoprotein [Alphaproteobacteria bacterium]|nr:VacJ family lipoprotein [Alphaproteobacteria bacterium]